MLKRKTQTTEEAKDSEILFETVFENPLCKREELTGERVDHHRPGVLFRAGGVLSHPARREERRV